MGWARGNAQTRALKSEPNRRAWVAGRTAKGIDQVGIIHTLFVLTCAIEETDSADLVPEFSQTDTIYSN